MEKQRSIDSQSGQIKNNGYNSLPQTDNNIAEKPDYGGAPPKEFSPDDPRNLYANQAYMDLPQSEHQSLKQQTSCKW